MDAVSRFVSSPTNCAECVGESSGPSGSFLERISERGQQPPPFRSGSSAGEYRRHMLNFLTYDFGYSWSVRYAMLVPLILAGGIAAFAAWRSWSRWVTLPMAIVALWAAVAIVILNAMLNRPMPLPTERFIASGSGRILDVGAGSGRASIGVLLARPHTTAIGVDI